MNRLLQFSVIYFLVNKHRATNINFSVLENGPNG